MRFLFGLLTIGGLLLFYEFVLVKPEGVVAPSETPDGGDFDAQNQGSDVDNSTEESQNHAIVKEDKALPLADVFGFLKNTLQGDQKLDDDSAHALPNGETAQKVKEYLIASSQLDFFGNPVELQLALRLAEDGDLSRLIQITQDFEAKYESFQKLVPPDPLARLHRQSLDITHRFIALLRDARDKKLGSVEATWNSPERSAIISESQKIIQELRDLVARYNIQLPSDVLP